MNIEEMQARIDELKAKLENEVLSDEERTAIDAEIKELENKIGAEKADKAAREAAGLSA